MDKHCYPSTVKLALECTFLVLPTIMDHYKDKHLDIDLLCVNKTLIFLIISRNIRFMYFKALLSKHKKSVQKGLKQIV